VAYVRVSTPEQSHELQKAAIERAALARGDRELSWFVETRSGRGWNRPELDALGRLVFAGGVRRVYVWRLDRFTRRGIKDTLDLVDGIRTAGCELVSVTDGFEFRPGPLGDLLISVMAWAAQMEGEAHRDRCLAARERMESEGRSWGRPPRVTPEQSAQIEALVLAGRSIRSISMGLHLPKTTVSRTVKRLEKLKQAAES
jgi:DNA invertase Pin-like site-specific DNA recombinase